MTDRTNVDLLGRAEVATQPQRSNASAPFPRKQLSIGTKLSLFTHCLPCLSPLPVQFINQGKLLAYTPLHERFEMGFQTP